MAAPPPSVYSPMLTESIGAPDERLNQEDHITGDWYSIPDLSLRDHRFSVPLDHSDSRSAAKIIVFAREVSAVGKEKQTMPYLLFLQGGPGFESPRPTEASGWIKKACEDHHVVLLDQRGTGLSTPLTVSSLSQFKSSEELVNYLKHFRADNIVRDAEFIRIRLVPNAAPWTVLVGKEKQTMPYLLFLQGGPGFESPRPTEASGWIKKACEDHHVVLLDQRGTGLSTPLTVSSLSQFKSSEELVNYLKHFRADNIVRDAEFIRIRLVPNAAPWTVLGQSYGGFCAVTYLSFAPYGLKSVLLTGGIPPIGNGCSADTVYMACYEQVVHQNEKYYRRFPQDIPVVCELVVFLSESEGGGVPLPGGRFLTPKGLQVLGLLGLGFGGGFERLHYMLERIWDPVLIPGGEKKISYNFLKAFENWVEFDTNPLFALLHESIYCQGASSRWSAHKIRGEYESIFDPIRAAKENRPVFFTGEMIFPWMFDEFHALRPFKEAAHMLAEKVDWPALYDAKALNKNQVPVAAAVYFEDMCVNFHLAMKTAPEIAGLRLWMTNEYMHSGLLDSGSQVFDQLMGMLHGKKPWF